MPNQANYSKSNPFKAHNHLPFTNNASIMDPNAISFSSDLKSAGQSLAQNMTEAFEDDGKPSLRFMPKIPKIKPKGLNVGVTNSNPAF